MRLIFSHHARVRMFERRISAEVVAAVVAEGEVIARYDDDRPYPSRLVLGYDDVRPLHVLVAENAPAGEAVVVTVYEPGADHWHHGWRERKRP